MVNQQPGKLYICGTPIGNLEDITLRSLKTLRKVDLIAAEDTRHTRKLLNHYHIDKPLTSYHEFNKEKKSDYILQYLKKGQDVALVSDAGMPGICDPGFEIINLMIQNHIQVIPIPGVSALITALVISGFDMSSFIFEGFIPKKKTEKEQFFSSLKEEKRTIIFYESPYRIKDTLAIIKKTIGERKIVITRELTKKFEEIKRGYLSEIISEVSPQNIKGELTLVLQGFKGKKNVLESTVDDSKIKDEIKKKMKKYLKKGYYNRDIVLLITKEYNVPKNWVYQNILEERDSDKL
ncbi:MAG: 16S rRNA (cytidine(1402)-2'-O)-methyltransferase [Atribacterota bacterium]